MKKKHFLSVFVLLIGTVLVSPLSADVTESFVVNGSFFGGLPGLNPGDQTSTSSSFASSPATTGVVDAINPRSILPGAGDVRFTADAAGNSRVDYDMGAGLTDTNLVGAVFMGSQINLTGINHDGDATNFMFDFTAKLFDGSTVSDISDLNLTTTNGSLNVVNNEGLFETEVIPTGGTVDITFESSTGSAIQSVQFRNITPDFETDELTITGSRTFIISVPEPSGYLFLGLMGLLFATRRRRNMA